MRRSSTETIIGALQVLARDVQSDDGVANLCLHEAAERMQELHDAQPIITDMQKKKVDYLMLQGYKVDNGAVVMVNSDNQVKCTVTGFGKVEWL